MTRALKEEGLRTFHIRVGYAHSCELGILDREALISPFLRTSFIGNIATPGRSHHHFLSSQTAPPMRKIPLILNRHQCVVDGDIVPKGGDERTGFLHPFTVFCWVPLSCDCASSILVYSGCVSVLLHLLLHAF